MDDKVSEDTL